MRVQFGAIITAGAGKAGGQIIQRGRTGQILRNLTKPVVRRNAAAVLPRNILSFLSAQWKFINAADRSAWNSFGETLTRYNKFGVAYTPTGYQTFMEFNYNAIFWGEGELKEGPETPESVVVNAAFELTFGAGPPSLNLTWVNVINPTNWVVRYAFFPLQSLGASVPRGSSLSGNDSADSVDESLEIYDAYKARFPFSTTGAYQVAVRVVQVNSNTGQRLADIILMTPDL